tara:strand:+ start:38 stop:463 length:426 start_codon:yes stop_codon:yes gene_type:complete
MILVLNILNRNNGSYLLIKDDEIIFNHNFILVKGEESILKELNIFFKKNKILLKNIQGLILFIKESSLTQVKVIVTIINILGWNFNIPVEGKFYFSENYRDLLPIFIRKIKVSKKFKYLFIKYKQKLNITLSKKKINYILE